MIHDSAEHPGRRHPVPPPAPPEAGDETYIYGINAVSELLLRHPEEVRELLLARDRREPRIQKTLEQAVTRQIPVHARPHAVLTKLAGNDHHQGLVAVVRAFVYTRLEDLCARLKQASDPLVVLLDGVQDPGNLGSLIRSAQLLGAHGLIVPRDRAAGVTPTVRKAASGATEYLPIVQVTNLARTMTELFEEHGIWMLGIDANASAPISSLDLRVPLGLVVGGEGRGLRPLTLKHCQLTGRIPLPGAQGGLDSLNAAVAGAAALYEIDRQRFRAGATKPG